MTSAFVQTALRRLFVVVFLCGSFPAAAQYTNGIYAEFSTSMGSFTCRLDYAVAPKAVANFIGLATGERAWLDAPSGLVRTDPFYNGTTFHRVIAGFMNQGGSRNGQGTDGPGYQFVDEFSTNALHDGFGVLSSANSGPDSNGSQFFITVAPQPHLNNVHTIFGRLYGGSNVVYAINHVATGGANKPLTNVVLQTVLIRRIGSAALAFNIHTNGLAVVANLPLTISRTNAGLSITFSNQLNANNRFYSSTNLLNWTGSSFGFETSLPLVNSVLSAGKASASFFRAVQVRYVPSLFVPRQVLGRSVTLSFTGGLTFNVAFDNVGGGSYAVVGGGSGPVFPGYSWTQDPYRGRLRDFWMYPNAPMDLHLGYSNSNSGTFKGTAYISATNSVKVSGTFSSVP